MAVNPNHRIAMSLRIRMLTAFAMAAMSCGYAAAQVPDKLERVFVPVEQFQTILQRDGQGVLMPAREFDELWNAAQANSANRPAGTPAILVTRANYSAEIRDRQLVIAAEVKFRQFENGWQVLPLPLSNLSIESAKVGETDAKLARTPQNGLVQFFNDKAGDGTLILTLVTPLAVAGSDQVAGFGLIPSAVAELKVTAPPKKHLLLDEQSLVRPGEADQPATYTLAVGGRNEVRLRLTDRQDDQKTDRLVFANSTIGVDASPGEITWQAVTDLQVFGATFNQLILTVPERLEIADVQSPGLEAWELAEDPDDGELTRITLNYRQPISGSRSVRVRGVLAMPSEEAWRIPMLSVKNVTSHVGHIVVTHPRGVRVQFLDESGVRRSVGMGRDPQQDFLVPIADRGAPQIFEFWGENAALELVMRSRERELIANIQNFLDFQYESVRYVAEIKFACRYAPLFEVDLELPAEWTPQLVMLNEISIPWQDVSEEAGVRRLRLDLTDPLVPGEEIKVRIESVTELEVWPPADEAVSVALPQITLPQVQLFDGRYFLNGDPDFELTPVELSGLTPVTFDSGTGERTAYEYQDTEIEGSVDVTRRPTQLSAQTLTFARLDPLALEAYLEARVNLYGAGRKQLQVSLPESVGKNVRFTLLPSVPGVALNLVEQSPAEAADGRIVWTLTTDRRMSGEVGLFVQATIPRDEKAASFKIPDLLVLGAERQHGIIAIEGRSEQSLEFDAVGQDKAPLREVDPADIPAPLSGYVPRERIVAAFNAFNSGQTVTLKETRFDRTAVPTAVCRQLKLRSILSDSGRWQHEAEAVFAAVGVQSLLVELPEGSSLWATLLDESPIEVRRVGTSYLIPLTGGTPGADRTLRIYYNNDDSALGTFGKLEQAPPQLAVDVLGKPQPLEILDQKWDLYSPGEISFIKNDGEFQQPHEFQPTGLLAGLPELFARVSWGHLWNVLVIAAIALIVLFIVDRGLRHWSLGKTLTICALVLFVGCLILAISMPSRSAREGYSSVAATSAPAESPASEYGYMDGTDAEFATPSNQSWAAPQMPVDRLAQPPAIEMPQSATPEPLMDRESEERVKADPFANRPMSEAKPFDGPPPPAAMEPQAPASPSNDPILTLADEGPAKSRNRKPDAPQDEREVDGKEGRNEGLKLSQRDSGARLSVDMRLEVPQGHQLTELHYYGTRQQFETSPLQLFYLNSESSGSLTGLVVVLVLGGFWIIRHRTSPKLLCLALGVALPLALVSIVPAEIYFVLDGILIGSLIAAGLWIAYCLWNCCIEPLCAKLCGAIGSRTACKTTAATLLMLVGGFGLAGADEKPAPESLLPSSLQSALPHVALDSRWTVIVPYDTSKDPLTADKVFLTAEQFRKLWNAANPDKPLHGRPPAGAFISGAGYVAELVRQDDNRGSVKVTARLVIQHLGEGPQSVALPLRRVAIESASIDGEPAAISANDAAEGPAYSITTETPGLHVLDLVFRLSAQLAEDSGQFMLPLDSTTPGTLTFKLPAAKLNVRVNGATSAFRKVTEGESESILVPLPDAGSVTVVWAPPQAAAGVDRVVQVESQLDLHVTNSGLAALKQLKYRVRQGAVEELTFQLPNGWSLQTISGQDVGGWQMEGEDAARVLRVFLRRSVDDETSVSLKFFQSVDVGSEPVDLSAPSIVPLEVTSEAGTIGLFGNAFFVIRAGEVSNVTRIDNSQFPQPNVVIENSQLQLAYRHARSAYELPFSILRKEPEAKTLSEHGVNVGRTRTQIASHFGVDLSGTPRSRFSILLPEGYVVLDVQATSLADWFQAESADGNPLLILELPEPVVGRIDISVSGYLRKYPDDPLAEVLVPVLLDVSQDKTQLAIWGIENYGITPDEVDGWNPIDAQRLSGSIRQLRSGLPQLAFEATQILERYLSIEIKQTLPELAADSVIVVNVTDTAIVYQMALRWEIKQAAAERLVFTTPDWLAGKLDFTDAVNVRNYSSELTDDGRVRWTVQLAHPQKDEFFLSPLAIVPVPADKIVPIPRIGFERTLSSEEADAEMPPSPAVEKQRHYAALLNGSSSQLDVVDAALLEPVPADQLPIRRDNTSLQQATDIFRLRPERELPTWTMKLFERQRGAEAIVNHSDLLTVLARDGGWRMQAEYLVRNRSRQFLPLKLPADARLLSAYVKGQPVRPVTTKLGETPIYLLPLPKASEADLSFTVTVTLAGRLKSGDLVQGVRWIGEEIDLPAPEVVSKQESPELGIPVTRTRWTVWVPDRLTAEEVDDVARTNLSRQEEADAEIELRLAQLREANDLLTSLKGRSSLGVQSYAIDNVRTLNDDLSETIVELERYGSQSKVSELRAEQQKLNLNYEAAQSELSQQVDVTQNGQLGVILNSGVNNFNEFSGEQQLELLREGNRALYSSNGVTWDDQQAAKAGESVDFDFNIQIEKERLQRSRESATKSQSGKKDAAEDQTFRKRISNSDQTDFYQQEQMNSQLQQIPNQPGAIQGQQGFGNFGVPQRGNINMDGNAAFDQRQLEQLSRSNMWSRPNIAGNSVPLGPPYGLESHTTRNLDRVEASGPVDSLTIWTSTAGLSLDVKIPTAGHKLTFTKVGGNPRLALNVKPDDSTQSNLRLGWSIFWLAVVGLIVWAFRGERWKRVTVEQWLIGAIGFGLALAAVFPLPIAAVGILLMLAAAVSLVAHRYKTRPEEAVPPPAETPAQT